MSTGADRRAALLAVDGLAAFAAVFAAVYIRFGSDWRVAWIETLGLPAPWILASVFAGLTFATFAIAGTYRSAAYWTSATELRDLAKGMGLLLVTTLGLLYLFKLEDVSRITLLVSFMVLGLASGSARLALRSWRGRPAGTPSDGRWIVVGNADRAAAMARTVRAHPHLRAEIVGFVGAGPNGGEVPWLGSLEDLPQVLSQSVVDEVVTALDGADWHKVEAVLVACAEQGKTVRIPLDAVAPSMLRGRLEEFDGVPMWSVLSTPEHTLDLAVKRLVDIVGSAVALVVVAPLLLAAIVAVRLVDGAPVLFRQQRGGFHGRPFEMLKIRTMVPGAEEQRPEMAALNERTGPVFKIADDPRVTRLGKVLRKWSIDELPQLWNVLRGEMSLVGPRPQPLEEVEQYDLWHRRRLSMRPGITGLWQVRARHDPSFDTWMDLDLAYIDRWSLLLDASIILRTPVAVLRSRGI